MAVVREYRSPAPRCLGLFPVDSPRKARCNHARHVAGSPKLGLSLLDAVQPLLLHGDSFWRGDCDIDLIPESEGFETHAAEVRPAWVFASWGTVGTAALDCPGFGSGDRPPSAGHTWKPGLQAGDTGPVVTGAIAPMIL